MFQATMKEEDSLVVDNILEQAPARSSSQGCRSRRCRRALRIVALFGVVLALVSAIVILRQEDNDNAAAFAAAITAKQQKDRAEAIVTFINSVTLTQRAIAYSPPLTVNEKHNANISLSSAGDTTSVLPVEELALQWLIERDDPLLSSLPLTAESQLRLRQRYALLTLWFQQEHVLQQQHNETLTSPASSFASTLQRTWTNTTGWATAATHECRWYGVSCAHVTAATAATTENNVITSLQLPYNNVRGALPVDLGLLTVLTSFNVHTNYLSSSIPSAMVAPWTRLVNFSAYKNALTGVFPDSTYHWNQTIEHVLLHENQLYGTLPSHALGAWTRLREFNVNRNNFTGRIPSSIGPAWSATITSAQFSVNRFNGTLPSTLGEWTAIREFRVASNGLTGKIPDSLRQWQGTIQEAYFQDNNLTGSMPICESASAGAATTVTNSSAAMTNATNATPHLKTLVADCTPEISSCDCCTYRYCF